MQLTVGPKRSGIGRSGAPTPLAFGGAPLGNLYEAVNEEAASAAVAQALASGINFFDTAPYYGYGLSEERLGRALGGVSRESFMISTKVGRRIEAVTDCEPPADDFVVLGRRAIFDYSREGVMRSFESSLARLRVDYVDALLLHDIGVATHGAQHAERLQQALDEALPAMAELKSAGACRAIGLGVNEEAICLELMPRFPLDCIMLAGRYTLLEHERSRVVMDEAARRSVSILIAGPYNSGLLADAKTAGATYNYLPVDPVTLARARRIYEVCARHGVEAGAAAIQFPLAHPAVATVVAGLRSADEVRNAVARLERKLPAALWQDLRAAGLLGQEVHLPP